ncbi:MAG: LytR C-terminal domain-containing protein [Rhodothermales bacterium]
MSKQRAGWTNVLFNLALGGLGLAALVLLYALVTRSFSPPADATREDTTTGLVGDIIQVEVRNGCGIAGLGAKMTHFLRQGGFDVVEVGNHTSFNQAKTIVVDRVGDLESAKKVARAIGLSEDRVVQEIRQDYFLDASVIIGQDYATLVPFEDE